MSNPDEARPPVVVLSGVSKSIRGKITLSEVSATFRRRELAVIRSTQAIERMTLLRLLAGQSHPDAGDVWRAGRPAPPPGTAWGFARSAPVMQSLDLRAAAFGVATRPYAEAIAGFMDEPAALLEPFEQLQGRDRMVVTFASAWLLPADLFVFDTRPLPTDAIAKRRLLPLWREARRRAAVVWLLRPKSPLRAVRPNWEGELSEGRLRLK